MRLITKKYVKKLEENVKVREQRRMEESRVETVYIIRPNHLNAAGRLFGGMLVQWIDEVAGIVAMRHTGHRNDLDALQSKFAGKL